MDTQFGKLYLIPTGLGDNPMWDVLPQSIQKIIDFTDDYIVENEKTARRFIKQVHPEKSQPALHFKVLNKYTEDSEKSTFLEACKTGRPMGLLSEAGCPAIADPGSDIVKLAHDNNIQVVPLVGPSSIIMALMGSGMNGQSFAFNGYLPIDKQDRKAELKRLERLSQEQNQSQLFIETPYRNNKMLEDLCNVLHPQTRICVACDLTLSTEYIKTFIAKDWKHTKVDLHKRPAIFIIHKD
ncbi:16S rRNA (cytidine1402-2'-O)-methyltransferase [Gelidibacter sediminis]|uniref:16S rRNA (Cytidine1402-2'-O)-methyltransferase n=1 Tax=Gelidibacter sediminis TaxID=1608710 RepID=A0A4R7PZU2_9FLAO|nr:SAM-dependent methyltransferase [Gelidibacter sediminis]TDU40575.1 16S rRNA (cytidine1402-2'-O)-methyltransferase [Gelidibacter sediminis]